MHIFYQLMMLTDAEHTTSSCLTIISAFKTSHYGSHFLLLPRVRLCAAQPPPSRKRAARCARRRHRRTPTDTKAARYFDDDFGGVLGFLQPPQNTRCTLLEWGMYVYSNFSQKLSIFYSCTDFEMIMVYFGH